MQKIKIWPHEQWFMHKPEFVLENETNKIQGDFKLQTDHRIRVSLTKLVLINKKNIACNLVDSAFQANHRVKNKRKQEVTVIPIIIGCGRGMVSKSLENRLGEMETRGRIKSIQTVT